MLELERKEEKFAYLLVMPALLVIFLFFFFPLIYSFSISFFKFVGLGRVNFVGSKNYIQIFQRNDLRVSLWRTAIFSFSSVGLELFFGLFIALALNEDFKGRSLARALIIVPWAVPSVVSGIMWKWMLHAQVGVINYILQRLLIIDHYVAWLGSGNSALMSIIVADVWKWTPLCVIILLAGLQSIPGELYEAGRVDGASAWQNFVNITLPLLRFPILVVLVLRTMEAFRIFDIIYVMTKGGPATFTKLITYYVFDEAFRYLHFGYSAALSYTVSAVILVVVFIYISLLRREETLI